MNEFIIKNYIDNEDKITSILSDITTVYEMELGLVNKYEKLKKRIFNEINIILLRSYEKEIDDILKKIEDMLNKKQIPQNNF
jgi:hypothetical protein